MLRFAHRAFTMTHAQRKKTDGTVTKTHFEWRGGKVEPSPNTLLEGLGYIAVVIPWCVGVIVIGVCAWKGARSYVKELETARQEKLLLTGKEA
jgi:hypothetical protein